MTHDEAGLSIDSLQRSNPAKCDSLQSLLGPCFDSWGEFTRLIEIDSTRQVHLCLPAGTDVVGLHAKRRSLCGKLPEYPAYRTGVRLLPGRMSPVDLYTSRSMGTGSFPWIPEFEPPELDIATAVIDTLRKREVP